VLIETVEPNGDGTATLTFTFDHGCEGEPTDTMDVSMPDGVEALAAGAPDGWTAELEPGSVLWTGKAVPDGDRAEFTLDVRVTGTVGQSFAFPAEQRCAGRSRRLARRDAHRAGRAGGTSGQPVRADRLAGRGGCRAVRDRRCDRKPRRTPPPAPHRLRHLDQRFRCRRRITPRRRST
jgi:hypothetical protein